MSDLTVNEMNANSEEDAEAAELGKALRLGFVIGTPITFAVFFVMIRFVAGVDLGASLITAIWVAIVGGGFYGGVTGLLAVLNRHGH